MEAQNTYFFVIAATVSAELYKAMRVAREISLTASNARALALRAGQSAAGFRAITDFIDELAAVTVNSSRAINSLATQLSRTSAESARTQDTLNRLQLVKQKAQDAPYLDSLDKVLVRTLKQQQECQQSYDRQVYQLQCELETIAKELRTAVVLSAMSRVEASQTSPEYSEQLRVIANNVAGAAATIQAHVKCSQSLFVHLVRKRHALQTDL